MSDTFPSSSRNGIRNGLTIPLFKAGESSPSVWSANDSNLLVKSLNALLNPFITRGKEDLAELSDGIFTIQIQVASQLFQLVDVKDDYVVGYAPGLGNTVICKPHDLQCTMTSKMELGVLHSFEYSDGVVEDWGDGSQSYNKIRNDDDGSVNENQVVVPPWCPNEIICAVPCEAGDAHWYYVGPSRLWTRKRVQ